jgi:hypothetical protein
MTEKTAMKFQGFGMDANGRSIWREIEIPMKQVSPLHAVSARQEGTYWGFSLNQPGEPLGGGPTEMHLTNSPRIVWPMSGHLENTVENGEVRRYGPGQGNYVTGPALHHASFARSREPVITLSLTFPGTVDYEFKV